MHTDYTAFLWVTEDGHIWWLLKDAICLGAGYLPVRDDHQVLAAELRAPGNRALTNERTLIGAFGDTRLTIEKPMTFERDGFRYVDAEGFLLWLSQYLAQTQAEIPFPTELESETKVAIAKAAALQLDYQRDPATEQEQHYWWHFYVRLRELKAQVQEWQAAATPTARDISLKESRLKELQQEIDRMKLQQRPPRGNCYPGRKDLNALAPVKHDRQGGRPKGPLREAVEIAYHHFLDKGDVVVLQANNIRSFMKSFASLAKDDVPLVGLGKRNIKNAICERIKEVKIPREGKCFVTTHDRTKGKKIALGRRYSQEEIAKMLTDLRKKYPLSP